MNYKLLLLLSIGFVFIESQRNLQIISDQVPLYPFGSPQQILTQMKFTILDQSDPFVIYIAPKAQSNVKIPVTQTDPSQGSPSLSIKCLTSQATQNVARFNKFSVRNNPNIADSTRYYFNTYSTTSQTFGLVSGLRTDNFVCFTTYLTMRTMDLFINNECPTSYVIPNPDPALGLPCYTAFYDLIYPQDPEP